MMIDKRRNAISNAKTSEQKRASYAPVIKGNEENP